VPTRNKFHDVTLAGVEESRAGEVVLVPHSRRPDNAIGSIFTIEVWLLSYPITSYADVAIRKEE
jgi:hypothetical protein